MKGKIFNTQEVQAMLNGSKVMFREVIKPQPRDELIERHGYWGTGLHDDPRWEKAPYQVGQKIFVKESYWGRGDNIIYKADYESYKPISLWCRAMKQEHSRLTPLIKEIKVERLAEISADDCWKEGIAYSPECCQNYIAVPDCNGNPTPSCCNNPNLADPRGDFKAIWNATHKKPEEKFEASPFCWVVSFEIINN